MARDYWGNVMDVVGSGLMDTYKVQQDTAAKKAQAIRDAEKAKQERQRMQIDLGQAADQSRVTESNLQTAEKNRAQIDLENQRLAKAEEAKNKGLLADTETTKRAIGAAMAHVDSDKLFSNSGFGKMAKTALLNNDLKGYYDAVEKYEAGKNQVNLEGVKTKSELEIIGAKDKAKEKEDSFVLPGYEKVADVGLEKKEKTDLREGIVEFESFKSTLKNYRDLIQKYGTGEILNQTARGEMASVAKNLQLGIKKIAALGVLSKGDEPYMVEQVPNPGLFQTKDKMLGALDMTEKNMEDKINQQIKLKGFAPISSQKKAPSNDIETQLIEKAKTGDKEAQDYLTSIGKRW